MAHEEVASAVVSILEEAGEHYFGSESPDLHCVYLLQVGGTRELADTVGDTGYWRWVQALLDYFFSAAERAEICARLLQSVDFGAWPGSREFHATALAEQRLQELLQTAHLASSAPAR
jgi:hypothetical protein